MKAEKIQRPDLRKVKRNRRKLRKKKCKIEKKSNREEKYSKTRVEKIIGRKN